MLSIAQAWLAAAGTLGCTTAGQLCIRRGMQPLRERDDLSPVALLAQGLRDPWIIGGLLLAALAACCWILALSRLPLAHAYPWMAASFPLVTVAAWACFNEPLGMQRLAALTVITVGLVLLGSAP
jgi:drug/metabolite transporter (DMT)-like permease